MTQSGTLLGTPSYMSPEQAMGEKLDGRSDIFSLGVCAFEMLSGEQPFPGNNVTSILYKLVHVDPIEPANLEMNGLVPQKWHEVFGKVLAKKPDDRYQTATEFVQDLEYCLGSWFGAVARHDARPRARGRAGVGRRRAPPERARRPAPVAAAATVDAGQAASSPPIGGRGRDGRARDDAQARRRRGVAARDRWPSRRRSRRPRTGDRDGRAAGAPRAAAARRRKAPS